MNLVDYLINLEARNSNGFGNNQGNPTWGAQDAPLLNLAAPHYSDGVGAPRSGANAREISNAVLAQDVLEPSSSANSDLFTFFGQFIDHDIDLTPDGRTESLTIRIPEGDGVFDPGSHLTLGRSVPIAGTGTDAPRQFANEITSFVDASNIYGSSAELTHMLRANDGAHGKSAYLLTSQQGGLPTVADFRAVNPDADLANVLINPRMSDDMFVAGDVRANENAALTSIHLMWVREHNLRVDQLREMQPGLSEDQLFEGARVIVEAEYQNIVFNEYLPQLVGLHNIPVYTGYDASVDASIASEFSTAAYRLGHSQISSKLQRLNEDGSDSHAGHLNLFQAFFNPANLQTEDHLSTLIRGLSDGVGQEIDTHIVDDVRNLLFGSEGQGSDLGALNIMRGRDHGLATLNETREALGLAQYTDFSDLTSDVGLRAALQSVYHTIDDVELWVGGLSEDTVPGSQLGSTFHTIVLDQFVRLRDGDRFFFEERLADNPELLAEIENTSLSDIITRTTDVDVIQSNVFVAHNRLGGTDAADVLDGTEAHDIIIGFGGDDVMHGHQGNDDLYGGRGNDTLLGGQGDDVMHGGEGNNTIVGGNGYNTAVYAHGIDTLNIDRTEDGTGFVLWNDDKFDLLFDVDHVTFNDGFYNLFDDGSIVRRVDNSIHSTLFDANPDIAKGLAAAYQVLLDGVPNQAGFTSLINNAVATNFGAGPGVVFNAENIFINLANSLVQGNHAAATKFDTLAPGATLQEQVTALYGAIVPAANQTADGLAFLIRPDGLAFYQAVAAERGVAGPDGAAIVAMASLLQIAVTQDIGIGDNVNDLIMAVNAASAQIPAAGNAFTDINVADGTAFDGDDVTTVVSAFTLAEDPFDGASPEMTVVGSHDNPTHDLLHV